MERIEIHISYDCVNDCIFCSEGSRLKKFKNIKIDIDQLKDILIDKRKKGFEHVTFTDGEPNMYSDFLELLEFTKSLGYRIYVGSNGGFWADKAYLNKVLPYLEEVSLSLHGSTAKIHDFLTKKDKSFSKIQSAFSHIDEYVKQHGSPYFMVNISLTNYNVDDILNILKLVKKYQVKQVLISNISPEGTSHTNYKDLAVRYSNLDKYIPQWIDFANKNDLIIRLFGLPLCVINGYEAFSNDLSYDPRTTYALGREGDKVLLKERKTNLQRRRIYVPACDDCLNKSICGGVFARYVDLFGDKEINKIK